LAQGQGVLDPQALNWCVLAVLAQALLVVLQAPLLPQLVVLLVLAQSEFVEGVMWEEA
jgi:hypothetical protein